MHVLAAANGCHMTFDPRDGRFPGDPHGRVGWGWGGVGDDNVLCTCTHGRCYATSWDGVGDDNVPSWSVLRNIIFLVLAHMVAATQHHGMGWGGVGWGMITFLALAHMVGATQHHLSCAWPHGRCYATSWDGVGWGGVGDDNVPCTCTHGLCYATSWDGVGWGGVGWGMITFLSQHQLSCTCRHGRCYATSWDGVG